MEKYDLTLWTDEMIFMRAACLEQIERYSASWRDCFIKYDASIAAVYLPAIRACQRVVGDVDKKIPR